MIEILTEYRSPNFSSRHGAKIDVILLHHTGGKFPGDIQWLCNPDSGVSAHYYISKRGEIFQLVDDVFKAWHAGRGAFDLDADGKISQEERRINARSIGIELESRGDIYTTIQLIKLDQLVVELIKKHDIPPYQILGHKEIAPGRKWDPGSFNMDTYRLKIWNHIASDQIDKLVKISIPKLVQDLIYG